MLSRSARRGAARCRAAAACSVHRGHRMARQGPAGGNDGASVRGAAVAVWRAEVAVWRAAEAVGAAGHPREERRAERCRQTVRSYHEAMAPRQVRMGARCPSHSIGTVYPSDLPSTRGPQEVVCGIVRDRRRPCQGRKRLFIAALFSCCRTRARAIEAQTAAGVRGPLGCARRRPAHPHPGARARGRAPQGHKNKTLPSRTRVT